jgi:hypothetical protein
MRLVRPARIESSKVYKRSVISMARRYIVLGFSAILGALFLVGCGGEGKQVDPYAEVTLQEVTRGSAVISKGFKYKLRNPEIVEMAGHLLIVKEGNIMEMIAGRSIADKLEGMDLSNVEFNVVKHYSPYTHFKCEQIVSGEDTVFISRAGGIDYPRITAVDEFESEEHEEYDLDRVQFELRILRWLSHGGPIGKIFLFVNL